MKKKIKVYLGIWFFIALIISGSIILHNINKRKLRESIENGRKVSAQSIEDELPAVIVQKPDYLNSAVAHVELQSQSRSYTDYEGKPARYYEWNDNITLECSADKSFNSRTDAYKLEYFKNLSLDVYNESETIQSRTAPIYDTYFHKSEIVNVFDEGVFCHRNITIMLKAGDNKYEYHRYSYHVGEAFYLNGKEIYPGLKKHEYTTKPGSNTTTNNSNNRNSVTTTDSYDKGYEDVWLDDDYDDDRYYYDDDYALGVDDAMDEYDW